MEFFEKAKSVRLRNRHGKFLRANDDQISVAQDRDGTGDNTVWQVEVFKSGFIRFKSCYNCYLKATTTLFILGATGKKVQQGRPYKLDRSVEWEPVKEGSNECRLQSYLGTFLRSNHGLPPWRNSVTHDASLHRALQHTVAWEVQVVESLPRLDVGFEGFYKIPSPKGGRLVYYSLCDGDGEVTDNGDAVWPQLNFKGQSMGELTLRVKQEMESKEDIILCAKSPSGDLYPLRLALPPNNAPMHVFVIKVDSTAGKKLLESKATDEDSSDEDEALKQIVTEEDIYNDEDLGSPHSDALEDRLEETNSGRYSSSSSEPLHIASLDLSGR